VVEVEPLLKNPTLKFSVFGGERHPNDGDLSKVSGFDGLERREDPSNARPSKPKLHILSFVALERSMERASSETPR
jgi:hypothetical protein